MTPIHAFLNGTGRDDRGRRIAEILAMDDAALEFTHDYIQWLFPLATPSMAQPGSPVLAAGDIPAIRADPLAQANLARATVLMSGFYARSQDWLNAYDHNHLRITRIVTSLKLLVGRDAAASFLASIEDRCRAAGDPVNARSRRYWREALDG